MPIRAKQSSFHRLLAGAAGLTCAAALAIGLTIWWLHADAIADASSDANNLAVVLADQIENSIQSIDIVLDDINRELNARAAIAPNDFNRSLHSEDTYRLLLERLSRLSQAERILLIDKNGRVANTTIVHPASAVDLSDRDYFQYLKNNDDKGLFISQVTSDRRVGARLLVFSKRINGANHEFDGVILISIKFSYFEHIYHSITSIPGRSILLLRKNGTVIVRYPDSKTRTDDKLPAGSPWYRLVAQGGGQYRAAGYFDDKARLIAVRPLGTYPLVVNVGVSETAALATWRMQAITLAVGAFLVMLCVAYLIKAQSRQFNRLAASEATIDAALSNMSQGLAMFDSSSRLVICNRRYIDMYGLSPEVVRPGCSLRELLDHRVATGSFDAADIEQYMADIQAVLGQQSGISKYTELRDGRVICVVNQPTADGGWVATHEDVTEQKRAEERIAYAAHVDALTGLPNRRLFCEQLEEALKCARRGKPLAVLYLDLDHLKRVNDTLGHPIGDKLLIGVADCLRGCVRDIDLVARLSGDEFAIVQMSLANPSDAATLAVRVREAIHQPFDLDGHKVTVDISVGISIAPDDATELHDLMKTADIALYEAKNTGRGTYCFYEPKMNARMQARSKLERDLHSALANGEFELYYQPIVSLENNKIASFEALLRWLHPERGLISSAEFIPVAEETGLIVPLGEWVLRTACAEAATWPDDINVAVNVSSIQVHNKNLVNIIIGAIASAGVQAERLILEITESIFLQNTFANLATLRRLHGLGVRFSMDDFGTGYSSLGYLLSFPFSKIKIDRSFIAGLTGKDESHAIVRAIADLARNLKIWVVAEGVETAEQLEEVRTLGCTDVQGYLISVPRPAAKIYRLFLPHRQVTASIASQVA